MNYLDNPEKFIEDIRKNKMSFFEDLKHDICKKLEEACRRNEDFTTVNFDDESKEWFEKNYSDKWSLTKAEYNSLSGYCTYTIRPKKKEDLSEPEPKTEQIKMTPKLREYFNNQNKNRLKIVEDSFGPIESVFISKTELQKLISENVIDPDLHQ
jgi:hypothetical protein